MNPERPLPLPYPRLCSLRAAGKYFVALGLALGIGISGFPIAAFAQEYVPPSRGLPGRREGGGTRGGCLQSGKTLTALMPEANFGQTLSGYPTFFWYVPSVSASTAEFLLLDEQNEEIYQTTFLLEGNDGIIGLSLPSTVDFPALEVGKDYHWYFSIVCDANDRSADIFVEGWVQRIEPDAELVARLETAAPEERPAIYAESGIWYEAVGALAALRRSQPNSTELLQSWNTLLNSVGLGDLSNKVLLPQSGTHFLSEPAPAMEGFFLEESLMEDLPADPAVESPAVESPTEFPRPE